MKDKEFITFRMPKIHNPLIVRKDLIESIVPDDENELISNLFLVGNTGEYYEIDEPTYTIEGRL